MLTLVGYIGYINNPKGTDHGRLGAEICELISCHGRFIENPSRKQALLWLADFLAVIMEFEIRRGRGRRKKCRKIATQR